MTQIDWKSKLSSRKFWASLVGVIVGLAMTFGLDSGTISDVAGAVVSIMSLVSYIITEGKIDAARISASTAHQEIMVTPDKNTSAVIATKVANIPAEDN